MKITYNEWKEDEILKLFENQQKIVTKEPGKIKESVQIISKWLCCASFPIHKNRKTHMDNELSL